MLKNNADRKRLFEAIKDTYTPSWAGAWAGKTYFERGFYANTYLLQVVMDIVNKKYLGVKYDNSIFPMSVEEFINKYIQTEEGVIML